MQTHHEANFGAGLRDLKELLDTANSVASEAAELKQIVLTVDTYGRRIHVGISTNNIFQKKTHFCNVWEHVDWFNQEEGNVVNAYISFMGPAGIRLRFSFVGAIELLPPLSSCYSARVRMSLRQASRIAVIRLRSESLLRDILVESVRMDELTFEKRFFNPLLSFFDNAVSAPLPERERRRSSLATAEYQRRIVNKKGVAQRMAEVKDLWRHVASSTDVALTNQLLKDIIYTVQSVSEFYENEFDHQELFEFLSAHALRFDNLKRKHAWLGPALELEPAFVPPSDHSTPFL